ncbi:MAG: M6 family metalloprotease domain-containing protein [Paludibacter sp.]|jgi:M6 family metalloprotease-like protein|nr:M6 family metalloprotease domain-containing protein [Paludibacter sp.]
MKTFKLNILFLLAISLIPLTVKSVPASPYPSVRILPDGRELTVYLNGDEFFSYLTTEDGFIIRKNRDGFFNYVTKDTRGMLIETSVRVNPEEQRTPEELNFLRTIEPFPDMQQLYSQRKSARVGQSTENDEPEKVFPGNGSPKSLVILVNYTDVAFVTPNPKQAFTDLLNKENYAENGGTGSARDYFKVSSFGASSPEFVVVGPYTLPNNRAYYGENEGGNDKRPREMVMDACNLAHKDGVDFSQYDVDNDGIVDNVFIYYAGHNEAEHAPDETIWPHRWSLSANLVLNGKRIIGYACTSELRGSSGNTMCGIGTFAHEFGHVYGLPDYYATNGEKHHTVSRWNIMDAGAYLNEGRTPPTYSAYDRFFLGWLTPTLLKSPQDVTLPDLKATNKAYIISSTETHNMSGSSPNPVEFFTLEYRTRTGWDAFLPNSGMLITRIFYNRNDWQSNGPNNRAEAMGFDIIEADGVASGSTLPGDPFPGTAKVTSYSPKLRSGTDIAKPITAIKEENNAVSFRFMGGGNPPEIFTSQQEVKLFNTIFGTNIPVQQFKVYGKNLNDSLVIRFNYNLHFELQLAGDASANWKRSLKIPAIDGLVDTTEVLLRYNPSEPSFNELHYEYLIVSSNEAETFQTLISGSSPRPVYVVPPVANPVSVNTLEGFQASWNEVYDASGYYLTVYSTSEGTSNVNQGFDNGTSLPLEWKVAVETVISNSDYTGAAIPALELKKTGDFIETESYPIAVSSFGFYIRSIGENTGSVKVEAYDGTNWTTLANLNVTFALRGMQSFPVTDPTHRKFRISFSKGTASVAIDDITAAFDKQINYLYYNEWVTNNSFMVKGIVPSNSYFYKLKASDRTLYPNNNLKYENITAFSNEVEVQMSGLNVAEYSVDEIGIRVFTDYKGFIQMAVTDEDLLNTELQIFDTTGRSVYTLTIDGNVIELHHLEKGRLYILKTQAGALKILL